MHEAEGGKTPKQKWWCVTVGVVFDYVAVQSKAVMLLSHLDRISSGGNTCSRVCRVQSRHGNLDLIKEIGKEKREQEMGVRSNCRFAFGVRSLSVFPARVCADAYVFLRSPTICLRVRTKKT